nr:unnamed protein product [Callosobruchus analis]
MTGEIENKRKSRKVLRGSVTKALNDLDTLLNAESRDSESFEAAFELVSGKYDNLQALDREIYELLLENASEQELEGEMEACDAYVKRFITLRIKYNRSMEDYVFMGGGESKPGTNNGSSVVNPVENTGMRKFKLPRIEFKQYDGDIKGWLAFWAQFKKVHEDSSIECCDKIEYLCQATVPGSRAR